MPIGWNATGRASAHQPVAIRSKNRRGGETNGNLRIQRQLSSAPSSKMRNGDGRLGSGEGWVPRVYLTSRSPSCSGSFITNRATGSQVADAVGGLSSGSYFLQLDKSSLPPGPDHWVAQNASPRQFSLGAYESRADLRCGYTPLTD